MVTNRLLPTVAPQFTLFFASLHFASLHMAQVAQYASQLVTKRFLALREAAAEQGPLPRYADREAIKGIDSLNMKRAMAELVRTGS